MAYKFKIGDRVRIKEGAICVGNLSVGSIGIIRKITPYFCFPYKVEWGAKWDSFSAKELELANPIKRKAKK